MLNVCLCSEVWQKGPETLPKWVQDLSKQVTKELQSKVDWIGIPQQSEGKAVRMLDYACGSGLVSAVRRIEGLPGVARVLTSTRPC